MRLGADPELFLQNATGGLVSVIGKVGGSKEHPLQIIDLPKGFTLQEDNVALELGIPPATSAHEYFVNLKTCMDKALSQLPGLEFSRSSAASFPIEELKDPASWVFGCEPDYNAWTGKENIKPNADDITLRSAGGHIHVETSVDPAAMVRAMDFRLGVASVIMDDGDKRKLLYGKAGACRYKSYGPEYRVLSNFWIFDEDHVNWVWRNTARAEQDVLAGFNVEQWGDEIQAIINNNDKKAAQNFIYRHGLEIL